MIVHLCEQFAERFPKPPMVEQDAWFVMQPQLTPGQDFRDFVKRSRATRKRNKTVRQIEHAQFACMHIGDEMLLGDAVQTNFQRLKLFGDNARNSAARRKTRSRCNAHQSHAAPAIDHCNMVLREKDADGFGDLPIFLIIAGP